LLDDFCFDCAMNSFLKWCIHMKWCRSYKHIYFSPPTYCCGAYRKVSQLLLSSYVFSNNCANQNFAKPMSFWSMGVDYYTSPVLTIACYDVHSILFKQGFQHNIYHQFKQVIHIRRFPNKHWFLLAFILLSSENTMELWKYHYVQKHSWWMP